MFYDSLLYKLTVEQHALAGCRIRVRTMEIAKGLHSSDEENVQIGVHRNQNKMFLSLVANFKEN